MRLLCTLLAAWAIIPQLTAQKNFFTPVALDAVALPESAERVFEPYDYQAYRLDYDGLLADLAGAPMEFTAEAASRPVHVRLPRADGSLETFACVESPVMMPGLAAAHPEIRTYSGESLTRPGNRIRCSVSPYWGLHVFLRRADKGVEYIERLANGQNEYYMAYDRQAFPNELRNVVPGRVEKGPAASPSAVDPAPRYAPETPADAAMARELTPGPVDLKIYRFAVSTTGAFAQKNGGTKPAVLAKIVSVTNACNAIYEVELAIRLKLVDEEENVIYLDDATDPFSSNNASDLLNQNPLALFMGLGSNDDYDIGHAFGEYQGSGPGGVATLNSVCSDLKARASSVGNVPFGDPFFVVVSQEIGHQWNAGHTFNRCNVENGGYMSASACEPGSGSTIMSYAGACGPDNLQFGSDLYYHSCSILEIRQFVETGLGASCGSIQPTGNNKPVASAPYSDNFFIPIGTPFELTGSAADPDGDEMSYAWDEIDLGPPSPLGMPMGGAPSFRSFVPGPSPRRVFPRMTLLLANSSSNTEVLPTVTRDFEFAFVARDNRAGGGGIGLDTVKFKATALAGPFVLTNPTANGTVWTVGEYQTITWDVANTNKAPVNCQLVNILLSTDNGSTYPIVIGQGVPNNGKYCFLVPDNTTFNARVRVEAVGNIFFDISNHRFQIKPPTAPGFDLCLSQFDDQVCLPDNYELTVSTSNWQGFTEPIELSVGGLPPGVEATFTPNPVEPGQTATLQLTFPALITEGTFNVEITGTAGGTPIAQTLTLTTVLNNFADLALESPMNGATQVNLSPSLRWNGVADANTYEFQLSPDPFFDPGAIVATSSGIAADTFKLTGFLEEGKVYFWRVRPVNECGTGAWSEIFAFATASEECAQYQATDVPISIPSSQSTVESQINVPSGGVISRVSVDRVKGSHTFFNHLEVHLVSPAGTDVMLFKSKCSNYNGAFNLGFDDQAASAQFCPPNQNGLPFKPAAPLSAFNGQTAAGVWKLRVIDNVTGSGGLLTAFELELCSGLGINPPFIVNNNPLNVVETTGGTIWSAYLKAEDTDNGPEELVYTMLTVPQHGSIEIGGGGMAVAGKQFTQKDIDDGAVIYHHFGNSSQPDQFNFAVTDNEGGLVTGTFQINLLPVGTLEPRAGLRFDLLPNPASESVRLSFPETPDSDTRIVLFNSAGQQLRTWQMPAGTPGRTLDLGVLPQGVYAVTVENARAAGSRKLVVR
jgi:subtilisin-like proprotein convertase family protein